MYLKSLVLIVTVAISTHTFAQENCTPELIQGEYQKSALLVQQGPAPALTVPFYKDVLRREGHEDYVSSELDTSTVGGRGFLRLGSPNSHQIDFWLTIQAGAPLLGKNPTNERVNFVDVHCHHVSEFAGTYNWNGPKKMWVNAKGIGIQIENFENSALAEVYKFKVTMNLGRPVGMLTDAQKDLLVVDENQISISNENPTATQIYQGLGASNAQTKWIESLPTEQGLQFLLDTLPSEANLTYYNLIWLMPRLENIRALNPEVTKNFFSDLEPVTKRRVLAYAVLMSTKFYDLSVFSRVDLKRARIAAAYFLSEVATAENSLLILKNLKKASEQSGTLDDHQLNNLTAVTLKIGQISNLSSESTATLIPLAKNLTTRLQTLIEINETSLKKAADSTRDQYDVPGIKQAILKEKKLIQELSKLIL